MEISSSPSKIRIAKAIADCGYCSRRDAEALILQGHVRVNGIALSTPAFLVSPEDTILINGKKISSSGKPRIWKFYKPKGLLTTHKDPQGRPTVFSFLREKYPKLPRLVSIGRLDINSEGLLILSSAGKLAHYMESPKTSWVRTYRARVFGSLTSEMLESIKNGILEKGVLYKAHSIETENPFQRTNSSQNTWVRLSLVTGKNREVRKLFEHFGLQVNRLIRLSYGPFFLDSLAPGMCEEISFEKFRDKFPKSLLDA